MTSQFLLLILLLSGGLVELRADESDMLASLKAAGFKPQIKAGNTIELSWGNPPWTPALWQRLPELVHLSSLIAEGKCTDNAGIEVLTHLPHLEKLFINASTFDDTAFATLARIPQLKSLGFDHNHIFTGTGIASLKAASNLRTLGLGGCMKFTAEGGKACATLTQLESLKLHHLGLGDDTLAALAVLVNLRELEFDNSFKGTLTSTGLRHLSAMKGLQKLSLGEFVTTYDEGLKHLTQLPALKFLTLNKAGVSASDIAKLQAALPDTQIIHTLPSEQELKTWHQRMVQRNPTQGNPAQR